MKLLHELISWEDITIGMRVENTGYILDEAKGYIGVIVALHTISHQISVRWDKHPRSVFVYSYDSVILTLPQDKLVCVKSHDGIRIQHEI